MAKIILTLVLLCGFHTLLASSCSTLPKITKDAIVKAKTIFIGKVSKVELTAQHSKRITLQILEKLKAADSTSMVVYTPAGSSNCGLDMREGQQWYIFAYEEDGNSWIGLCGRSALLSAQSTPNAYKSVYYKRAIKAYKKERRRSIKEIVLIRNSG